MEDILGLADTSNDFAIFLTEARKFNFTCVYVFSYYLPFQVKLAHDNFTNKDI